jgi:hypothetical protein
MLLYQYNANGIFCGGVLFLPHLKQPAQQNFNVDKFKTAARPLILLPNGLNVNKKSVYAFYMLST